MRHLLPLLLLLTACDERGVVDLEGPTDKATADDTDVTTPDTDTPVDTDVVVVDTDTPDTDTLPAPTPAEACGEPDAVTGTVRPDLGVLPAAEAFTADPGSATPYGRLFRSGRVPNPTRGRDAIQVTSHVPAIDGAIAPGRFPLVVFMPGFGVDIDTYAFAYTQLTRLGFVVVSFGFPNTGFLDPAAHDKNALEAKAVIDWALTTGPHKDSIDATKIATVGHSQGGKIAFYVAALDPRVDIVVGWDPQNGGGPPCFLGGIGGDCNAFPVAPNCESGSSGLLHQLRAETLTFAAEDALVTPDAHLRAIHFYRGSPSPAHLVLMPRAGHASWASRTSDAARISQYVTNALLLTRLQNRTGLEAWLPGGAMLDSEDLVTSHRSK